MLTQPGATVLILALLLPRDLVLDTPNESILQAYFAIGALCTHGLSELARLTARHDNGKIGEFMSTLMLRDLSLVGLLPYLQGEFSYPI